MTTAHPVRRAAAVAVAATACCASLVLAPTPTAIDDATTAAGLVLGIVAAFRIVAVVATGYIAVASFVAIGAALLGWSARVQQMWPAPMPVRRLVFGSSMALMAAAAPVTTAAADAAPARRPPTMVIVERPQSTGLHPDGSPPPATAPPATATDAAAPTPTPGSEDGTWTVRPGDHFWSIATAVVADELGRPGTDAEVHARWRSLIGDNTAQLVDPGNPDLLLPGQILRL